VFVHLPFNSALFNALPESQRGFIDQIPQCGYIAIYIINGCSS